MNFELKDILENLLIIASSAVVLAVMCHYLRVPTLVGFILGGVAVGPYGMAFVSSVPGAEFIAEIGTIFLLFSIGVESSQDLIRHHKRSFFLVGSLQVMVSVGVVAFLATTLGGFTPYKAIFLGCLVALSSTAIVMKLLQDARDHASPSGMHSIGVLLFQDLAVIVIAISLPVLAGRGAGSLEDSSMFDWWWLAQFSVAAAALVVSHRWILPRLFDRLYLMQSRELIILTLLVVCFGVSVGLSYLGISPGLGAFIAGILVSGKGLQVKTSSEIIPLRDLFLSLFFASIGMLIDFSFVTAHIGQILILAVGVFIIKVGIVAAVIRLTAAPIKTALVSGLYLFQIGEFSFILAGMGRRLGLLNPTELQYVLSVTAVTMIATPFVFLYLPKLILKHNEPLRDTSPPDATPVDVLIIGYGEAGMVVAGSLDEESIPYRIVDQNYRLVKEGQDRGLPIVLGDATNIEELQFYGIERAKLVVVCVSGMKTTQMIASKIKAVLGDVPLLARVYHTREAKQVAKLVGEERVVDAEWLASVKLKDRVFEVLGHEVKRQDPG